MGAALVLPLALTGCDGGGDLKEGVPENIDMTKDYSPKIDMPGMSPKIQKENAKKAAEGAKTEGDAAAPAATP